MELTGYAVYRLYRDAFHGSDRWKRNRVWYDGNRRTDQCDRICIPDYDVIVHGYICVRYDHDRRSINRPYYRSVERSTGDAGSGECGNRSGRWRHLV